MKDIFTKVKALFDAPPPVAPVAPVTPADTSNATVYTLQDGSQIAVQQAGDLPAPGDMVTVAGAPAPQGILTLQDGSMITCDATGAVTLYTPVGGAPVTTDVPGADAAKPAPAAAVPAMPAKSAVPGVPGKTGYNEQDAAALVAAFDTSTGNDLMTVLVTCVKALMQSEFGWQILEQKRLADTNAAITVYQTSLQASTQKFAAQEKLIAGQKALIDKHEATIKGLFEILEKVVELPTAAPKTITSPKKDEIEEAKKKTQSKFERMADSLKTVKAEATA